jgi:hypothetical protein
MAETILLMPQTSGLGASPKPRCPRCGPSDVWLISSQEVLVPATSYEDDPTIVTISTYKCRCGIGFTDTANLREKK